MAGRAYATFAAGMLNFKIFSDAIPFPAFALQIGVGLFVPILAAFFPVYQGQPDYRAAGDRGFRHGPGKLRIAALFDRWLMRLRGLSRPFAISLRNTFRRRAGCFSPWAPWRRAAPALSRR